MRAFDARPGNSAAASPRTRPPKLGVLVYLIGTSSVLQTASPRRTPISESLSRDSYGTTSIYLLTADMGSNEIKSLAPYRMSTIFVPDSNRRPTAYKADALPLSQRSSAVPFLCLAQRQMGNMGFEPMTYRLRSDRSPAELILQGA